MTKLETYQAARHVATQIARSAAVTLGRDSPSNDKHTFSVRFAKILNSPFAPMSFSIGCSYGYYGSSSGYSATSEPLGKYLARAIEQHASLLLDAAAKYAADDAEKARKEAEGEARAVLGETVSA